MAKIELSLKSNIDLITASGLFGHKLKESELTPLVYRISKNFYNTYSDQLAHTALGIWNEHHDRKHVHKILTIAYDIESEWRDKNPSRFRVLCMCNPHSYETVPFSELLSLSTAQEFEIRNKLSCLSEEDFEKTPYFRVFRSNLISHAGGICLMKINGISCGSSEELTILYLNRENARGMEHRHGKEDCTVVCKNCHTRYGLQVA